MTASLASTTIIDKYSGKSSVLEGLTDLPFPRDSGLCTRFATQITFRRDQRESITVSIIPSPGSSTERAEKLRAFRKSNLSSLEGHEFSRILKEVGVSPFCLIYPFDRAHLVHKACETMGIPSAGVELEEGQSTFTDDVLKIELCGPQKQHLSVIDIPGIFRTPTPGVTTKADMALVRRIVRHYIENKRTIILAVIPAPTDIATQEILTMTEEVDPNGERTLGVLTKPDLMDKGGEEAVIDLVREKKNPLRLGYCIVRNRGQQEVSVNSFNRHQRESEFFLTKPWDALDKHRVGIMALKDRLRELLIDTTRREFPMVRAEIEKRLSSSQKELDSLGPSRESRDKQQMYLLGITMKFQKLVDAALDAYYSRFDEFSENKHLKLATIAAELREAFSDEVRRKGHTYQFNWSMQEQELMLHTIVGALNFVVDEPPEDLVPALGSYPELLDLVEEKRECPDPDKRDILQWIERAYVKSKGSELGSFNPAVLSTIWKVQSEKWDGLAFSYIDSVIRVVHRFVCDLLQIVCGDKRVRSNLLSLIMEDLIEGYRKAVERVKFILCVERSGTLLTTNHRFAAQLEQGRQERFKSAMETQAFEGPNKAGKVVRLDVMLRSSPIRNNRHAAQEIHDILKSYYEIARDRFVDTVCKQGAEYHLLTGPERYLHRELLGKRD